MHSIRKLIQGRKADVVADALVHDDRLVVSVLGRIGDAVMDGSGNVVDGSPVSQGHAALSVEGGAEAGLADFVHTGLGQTAEAQDLALVKIEGHVVDASRHGHVADAHHDLVGDLFAVVRAVVVAGHFTADHQLLQSFFIDVLALHSIDVNAVAQDRDGVGKSQDLGKVVGDEDDRISFRTDPVHVLVEFLTAFLGKRRGGLVDDHDLRPEVGRLDDLHQLPVLEVVVLDHIGSLDALEPVLLQEFVRPAVHGVGILDPHLDEHVLMSEEDVLSHCQTVQCAELLDDDGNAFQVCLHLVLRGDLLSVQNKGAAVLLIDPGQGVGQCGLA